MDEKLRHCKEDPGKPILRDDTDEAAYLATLKDRGDDCESKLNGTWQTIDDARAAAERHNAEEFGGEDPLRDPGHTARRQSESD